MKRKNKKATQTPPNRQVTHTGALHSSVGFPGYSMNKKPNKIMQKIIILLFVLTGFISCIQNPETLKNRKPKCETVQLVFIADRSKSFAGRYTTPNSWLFSPTCEKASNHYTVDFRYGFITDSSNRPLLRYYCPLEVEDPKANNPWLGSETEPLLSEATHWDDFAEAIDTKLLESPTDHSDITSTLNRAIVSFQEYDSSTTRKILILCTDLEDSYTQLPHLQSDIEVYTVGLLPTVQVEKILNTKNVRRYESLESALSAISKTIN
jgi:hypothetical protein